MESGDFQKAREAYERFEEVLARHIATEHELLFPLFEARTGLVGPTAVLREEHRQIQAAVEVMSEGLERGDPHVFREGLRSLRAVLRDHSAKEEHVLYPIADRLLSESERTALLPRLKASP